MYLGIDLGTGSVKAVVIDGAGRIARQASRPYAYQTDVPGHAETAPAVWWTQTVAAVRECTDGVAGEIDGVGLSGQAHGVVLCDRDGRPLRPAILWPDIRSHEEVEDMRGLAPELRTTLANPLATGMTAVSLLWLRKHEPDVLASADVVLSPKDWIRHGLTGTFGTDPSDASMTLLYDLPADRWATEVLAETGLDRALLPPVGRSDEVAGHLTAEAAAALGLRRGVPVATGLADSAACLLGLGQIRPGNTILQVGSGIQLMAVVDAVRPEASPRYHTYRAAGTTLYRMAAMQNGGVAFDWARGVLAADLEEMYELGFAAEAGSGGVLFLPYLTGERTPHLNPDASGCWLHLRLGCTRGQLIRSVFEGIALAIRDGWDCLAGTGVSADAILLTGGGTTDPRWQQMLADVVQVPLIASKTEASAALGAAFLGGIAAGRWSKLSDLPFPDVAGVRVEPRPDPGLDDLLAAFHDAYAQLFARPR